MVKCLVGMLLVLCCVISVLVLVGLLIISILMLDAVPVVIVLFCGLKMLLLVFSRLVCFMFFVCGCVFISSVTLVPLKVVFGLL